MSDATYTMSDMSPEGKFSGLFTDFYCLIMMQACHTHGKNMPTVFDMFFRSCPFNGGFVIFAGLETLLDVLENIRFLPEDIAYLRSLKVFDEDFLDRLKNYRFSGELWAVSEGTVCFPREPLVRVHAPLFDSLLIEGVLLNILNFQTLIATKSTRVMHAAEGAAVMEFGLRRAQGTNGALWASRAAYIGGSSFTSNVLAGKTFDIPVSGTMAHSWVMAFPDEEEAFTKYADSTPLTPFFLIDTYDSLGSGIANAIKVGKKLTAQGKDFGIRLDSGDIEYLSFKTRSMLDKAGLQDAKIAVSNELDELIIQQLVQARCPIDFWGVGTHLVTGGNSSSLSGVYKLSAREKGGNYLPTMKMSDNPLKSSIPGVKQVYRFFDPEGLAGADLIVLNTEKVSEKIAHTFYHPFISYSHFEYKPPFQVKELLAPVMKEGRRLHPVESLSDIRARVNQQLSSIDATYKRIINPHIYRVSVSETLRKVQLQCVQQFREGEHYVVV